MATTKQQLIELRNELNSFSLKVEAELDKKIKVEIMKLSPLKQQRIKEHNSKPHKFDHPPGVFELRTVMFGKYIDMMAFQPWLQQYSKDFMLYIQCEIYEYIDATGLMAVQIEPSKTDSKTKYIRPVHSMDPYQLDDYILALLAATDMSESQKAA